MIEPMAKIEIVGMMEKLDSTLDLLQQLGTVEIIEIPTIEDSGYGHVHRIHLDKRKEELLAGYEELHSTVAELIEILNDGNAQETPLEDGERKKLLEFGPAELGETIAKIARKLRRLGRQRRNLSEDLESTRQYETLINAFLPMLEAVGDIGEREQIGLILKKGETSVTPILKTRVSEITGPDTLFLHKEMPDGGIGVYIVIAPGDLESVRELLGNEGVAEYHIPRQYRKGDLSESITAIRERIESIPRELAEIDEKLADFRSQYGAQLSFMQSLSTNRINQLRILSKLIRTKYSFVLSGWTPVSDLDNLKSALHGNFGESVHISRVKLTDRDAANIPTLLTNRGMIRTFEVLMKLLPPPKYNNLDATPFITFFFPLFFGIILGDMAYGLVLLTISGFAKWRLPRKSLTSDAASVAMTCGLSTIMFGLLFGEFLGDYGEHYWGMHPVAPWLHRANAIEAFLLISIGIGVIHVLLAFGLKTYLSIAMQHRKGVLEGLSKIVIIIGFVGIFVQLFLAWPVIMRYASFALLGIGIVGVVFTEGIFGLIELMSLFGNILSYSRIMAIGIASVILAVVANRLAEASPNIILAIAIGFFIHLINFMMGVFSPTIHSIRLHYVEFFSKFFNAQGRHFQPFKQIDHV